MQALKELEGFVGAEKGTFGVDDSICTSVPLKSQSCNQQRLLFDLVGNLPAPNCLQVLPTGELSSREFLS